MEKYEMKAILILFSHIELSVDVLYFLGRLTGNLHILDCCKFENNAKTYHCFKIVHVPTCIVLHCCKSHSILQF